MKVVLGLVRYWRGPLNEFLEIIGEGDLFVHTCFCLITFDVVERF